MADVDPPADKPDDAGELFSPPNPVMRRIERNIRRQERLNGTDSGDLLLGLAAEAQEQWAERTGQTLPTVRTPIDRFYLWPLWKKLVLVFVCVGATILASVGMGALGLTHR